MPDPLKRGFGYLCASIGIAAPVFLLIMAIPMLNKVGAIIVLLGSQWMYLLGVQIILGDLDKENKLLRKQLKDK